MGQDINEMMQEAPVLTLDPFGETKEEVVEVKEEQVEELDVLTPEEKKMVADFAAKIDLRSSNAILQYGAGAQKKIADFSESALENVKTKDLGEVGDMLAGVVTELKSFDEEEEEKEMTEVEEKKQERTEKLLMTLTMVVSFALAIGIFMVLPYFLSDLLKKWISSYTVRIIIEGIIRIAIFVAYVGGISVMNDIKRLYRYHGAEHKCINCIEHGLPLTVENVRKSSKEHKRCGTSFMLFVMIVGIVLLFFVRVESPLMRVIVRIALLPVIAGISYELIKWAGSSENPIVCILSKPGLWLQGLTTKEPDDEMIEVGIAAVEAVFDWKAYLRENFGYKEEE